MPTRDAVGILDDASRVAAIDPGGMLALIASLGQQLRTGYATGTDVAGLPAGDGVRAVVLAGMGGSGLAGEVLRSLYDGRALVPLVTNRGYGLPAFCGPDTLVIVVSFSGNTEETLSAYDEAGRRGCRRVTVSCGGALAERSVADGVPLVLVPPGVPVPRAAAGYLSAGPIGVLDAMGLVPPAADAVASASALLDELAARLGPERPLAQNPAKDHAVWSFGRTPLIWASDGLAEAAAVRWKNETNENAKTPAFAAAFPELDHNDIEGWSPGMGEGFALTILRHPGEGERTPVRVEATLEAIAGSGLAVRQVQAEGSCAMEWLMSLMMVGDFVSAYRALLRGVDPTPIAVLMGLKERLKR